LTHSFSQNLIFRQQEVDHALTEYLEGEMELQTTSFNAEEFIKLYHLRASIRSAINKRSGRDGLQIELVEHLQRDGAPSSKEDLDLFKAVLREASHTVSSWGGQVYFVYLPTWERYRLPALASKDRENVLEMVNRLAIPTVDIHAQFVRHPDPLSLFPSRRYAHYNAAGHRLVAEQVLEQLEEMSDLSGGRDLLTLAGGSEGD
jgi:hypothetical protein